MLNASSMKTNILVTVFVALLVILMPAIDRRICRKLGIDTRHRLTGGGREVRLLRFRRVVLFTVFCLYMAANVYLVFFSRSASVDYMIHVDPLNDVMQAVNIDTGLFGLIAEIYTKGLSEGLSHIHIEKVEDITQVYMNIMLFVPLGYLLPYTFDFFRAKVHYRPVLYCFIFSFIIENLQLIFKRGFYDMDDLISNTVGGLIGQMLYKSVAYVAAHPDWRKELKADRRWKRRARRRTLYPFAKKTGFARTTILASDEDEVWEFYVQRLGFRPKKQLISDLSDESAFLLQLGTFQLEVICEQDRSNIGEQRFALSVENIIKVKRRLDKQGFDTGEFALDPYTGLRSLSITGPDDVMILFLEA